MVLQALMIIRDYVEKNLDKSQPVPEFDVFIVWQCKTLQNWKFLLGTTLQDQRYYELTYNGDKKEWYLDDYVKIKNTVISEEEL